MADKTPLDGDGDLESLKMALEDTNLRVATMDDSIVQIVEDNKGLRQDFRALMDFLKKDEQYRGKQIEVQEGGFSVHGPRSTTCNTHTVSPSTLTRFGTLNADTILEHAASFMFTPTNSIMSLSVITLPSCTVMPHYGTHTPIQPLRTHHTQPSYIPVFSGPQIPIPGSMNHIFPSQQPLYTLPPYNHTRPTSSFNTTQTPPLVTIVTMPRNPPPVMITTPSFHTNHPQNWNHYTTGYKPPKVDFPRFEGKDP